MGVAGHREDGSASRLATGRALVPFVARPAPWPGLPWWKAAVLVAAFGLAAGLGGGTAYGLRHGLRWPGAREAAASAAALAALQDQVAQLRQGVDALRSAGVETARADEGPRGLRHGLETLRQDVDQARAGSAATLAALSAKIDKVDHDPSQKLADIAVRLDRIERQAAAAVQAPAPAVTSRAAPAPAAKPVAAVVPPAKGGVTQLAGTPADNALPDKPTTVGGWVLRDVYDGMALVEARGGGLREVEPGEYLPGAGQVRSIERRGRGWVVMTSRGVIDKATF